jgi:hypothetical protein
VHVLEDEQGGLLGGEAFDEPPGGEEQQDTLVDGLVHPQPQQ